MSDEPEYQMQAQERKSRASKSKSASLLIQRRIVARTYYTQCLIEGRLSWRIRVHRRHDLFGRCTLRKGCCSIAVHPQNDHRGVGHLLAKPASNTIGHDSQRIGLTIRTWPSTQLSMCICWIEHLDYGKVTAYYPHSENTYKSLSPH